MAYFKWDCWSSRWISCSILLSWEWQLHEQRFVVDDKDNMEDEEHVSDEEGSLEDVEQLVSDNSEVWAIRESKEAVERVVRRVVGVVHDELEDV